jgi:hypothetical protein
MAGSRRKNRRLAHSPGPLGFRAAAFEKHSAVGGSQKSGAPTSRARGSHRNPPRPPRRVPIGSKRRPSPCGARGFALRRVVRASGPPPDHPPRRRLLCGIAARQGYASRMDVHLAARLHRLIAAGSSIRAAARELGVSRSAAMRAVAGLIVSSRRGFSSSPRRARL